MRVLLNYYYYYIEYDLDLTKIYKTFLRQRNAIFNLLFIT